jgi:hypothetical protein
MKGPNYMNISYYDASNYTCTMQRQRQMHKSGSEEEKPKEQIDLMPGTERKMTMQRERQMHESGRQMRLIQVRTGTRSLQIKK